VKTQVYAYAAVLAVAGMAVAGPALAARDQVKVAGSSTVLPFANIVAEEFGKQGKFKAPIVESGGSGAGIKQFCSGTGEGTIDIANSSRKIKPDEKADCAGAGVADVMEVKIGYDGIVFASDAKGPAFAMTPKDWFLGIGAKVPVNGVMVANPYKSWKEVNPAFPDWQIATFIPGEKHGTREVFEQKVLVPGCKAAGGRALIEGDRDVGGKASEADKACSKVRKDGAAVDIDGDYTETLSRLAANKTAMGVFGLSFYESNRDKLRVATMNGVVPTVASVASNKYPVSRPLFMYVKKAHIGVIPGLKEYVQFFLSDKMAGQKGLLFRAGMVPMPAGELKKAQAAVK
jgi:phosphate transport system substrate-binding protein